MKTNRITVMLLTLAVFVPGVLCAEPRMPAQGRPEGMQEQQERGSSRVPPQAAIAACKGKSEGTSCSMVVPSGETKTGVCVYTPDNKYFACRPNDMPRQLPPVQQQ